jgi:hypothetical protein
MVGYAHRRSRISILLAAAQNRPLYPEKTLKALDVGCKNWEDIDGFARFLDACAQLSPSESVLVPELDGVELDAYRRYIDGTRRIDHAHAAMSALRMERFHAPIRTQYATKNVCDLSVENGFGPYDIIGWFLPFVIRDPLVAWGLPDKLFQPRQTLKHVISLLKPQGYMIITNQGDFEADAQQALLEECSELAFEPLTMPKPFYPYRHAHRGWICWKSVPKFSEAPTHSPVAVPLYRGE